MGVLIRTLLIGWLALAVAAQGVAAATLAFCGPHHRGVQSVGQQQEAGALAHAHHHDAATAQTPEATDGADIEIADAVAAAGAPAQPESGHPAQHKCSACASCCSLGALLATVPVFPVTDPAATVFSTVVPTVVAFAADGPDRPPRSHLV